MKNFCFFVFFVFFVFILNAQEKDSIITLSETKISSYKIKNHFSGTTIELNNSIKIKNDLGEIIKNHPNVSCIRRGGTAIDPVFRGFRNNQLLIMLNEGIRIEGGCPNRMDPVTAHIDADEIESISFFQGTEMLDFGPAIGGVMIIKTFQPYAFDKWTVKTKIKSSFESNFNGLSNSVTVFGGNKSLFFSFSGGYKNYGDYKDGYNKEILSSFIKYYSNLKIGYKLAENQTIRLNYTNSQARDVKFPALPMDEKMDNTQIYNANYLLTSHNSDKLSISIYHAIVNHNMDNSFRPQFSEIVPPLTGLMQAYSDVVASTTGFSANYQFTFKTLNFQLNTDIDHVQKDGNRKRSMIMNMNGLTTTSSKYDNLWKNANIINTGLSLGIKKDMIKKDLFQNIALKIRYDYNVNYSSDTFSLHSASTTIFDNSKQSNGNLSFGLQYVIVKKEKSKFVFGISRLLRNANMNERYIKRMPVAFDNYDYIGNPFIKAEKNYQFDFNYLFTHIEKRKSIGFNIFISFVDDYIGSEILTPAIITPATQGVVGVKQFKNLDIAYFLGGEFVYNSLVLKHIDINLSAGYTTAYLKNAVKYIISNNQIVDKEIIKYDPLPEIPPFDAQLNLSYKYKNQKFIPSINFRYIANQMNISDANYEKTTPDWFIINFSLDYLINKYIKSSIGVKNITNLAYYEHLNRRIIGSTDKLNEPGRSFYINLLLSL
jgi:iron complex outermembrane receptor protein